MTTDEMMKADNVINLESSTLDAVVKMALGNPGAAQVLSHLLQLENGLIAILHLDDMKIRGWKIWYAYKDYCKTDLQKFYNLVIAHDEDMQNFIRQGAIKMGAEE